jgi:DnaJ-domain-containing protein 1
VTTLIVYGLLAWIVYQLWAGSKSKPRAKPAAKPAPKTAARPKPPKKARAAHEVLGVDADAAPDDIRRAYQQRMREYHPDRVAGLAEELQELAERRAKEINAAYDEMLRKEPVPPEG